MLPSNRIAFKEWAAICAALAEGAQTLILRKGGIHEGRDGFRVAHSEFWLFPTYLHEAAAGLDRDAAPLLARAEADRPPTGMLKLAHYAVVSDVAEIRSESLLSNLAGLHLWSPRTVSARFHYRQPGLFALTVRVYSRSEPYLISDSPHLAGCRTWVDLPANLATERLRPVLDDEEFQRRREQIRRALASGDATRLT